MAKEGAEGLRDCKGRRPVFGGLDATRGQDDEPPLFGLQGELFGAPCCPKESALPLRGLLGVGLEWSWACWVQSA